MLFDLNEESFDEDVIENVEPSHEDGLKPARKNFEFFGHENVEHRIIDAINNDRLPHAVILSGMEGVGKSTFAYRLARFLLTRENQSGGLFGEPEKTIISTLDSPQTHPAQAQISSGGHPDLLTIERTWDEKKDRKRAQLDVDEVRKIAPFLRMTSSIDDGYRIVIVDDADTMNRNSQNAILKILEEPPPRVLLILITHRIGMLLPTILSRAAVLNFQSLDSDIVQRFVKKHFPQISDADLNFVLDMAQGSVGYALHLSEDYNLSVLHDIQNHFHEKSSFNWTEIQLFADSMGAKSSQNDDAQKFFIDAHIFLSDMLLKAMATQTPLPKSCAVMNGMFQSYNQQSLIELGEALRRHKSNVFIGNLDKRFLVMETYRLWEEYKK